MTLGISKLRYVDRRVSFKGIPSFSPEHFRYINNADPMKAKQLDKGVDQLMDEGVAQLFTLEMNNRNYWNGWCTSI
jgi:peptide subunit release factor RF-3